MPLYTRTAALATKMSQSSRGRTVRKKHELLNTAILNNSVKNLMFWKLKANACIHFKDNSFLDQTIFFRWILNGYCFLVPVLCTLFDYYSSTDVCIMPDMYIFEKILCLLYTFEGVLWLYQEPNSPLDSTFELLNDP